MRVSYKRALLYFTIDEMPREHILECHSDNSDKQKCKHMYMADVLQTESAHKLCYFNYQQRICCKLLHVQ